MYITVIYLFVYYYYYYHISIYVYTLSRPDTMTNEILQPVTFILSYYIMLHRYLKFKRKNILGIPHTCRMYLEHISGLIPPLARIIQFQANWCRGRNSTGDNEHLKSVALTENDKERERETGGEDTALVELKAFGRKSSVASCLSCQLLSAVYLLQMFRIHRGSRKSNEVARDLRVWMHLKQSLVAFAPLYLGIFVYSPCYSNSIDVIVLANRWMQREWCNVGNWEVALLWKFVND